MTAAPVGSPAITTLRWRTAAVAGFAAHAAEWDALNRRCQDLPFLSSTFLRPLLQHFGTGQERLALGEAGGRLVAAALLQRDGFGRWITFQPSQLPLGPLLLQPGVPLAVAARGLIAALPGVTLAVSLTQLDPLGVPRETDLPSCSTIDWVPTAWVDIDGRFDDYWVARGKNLRQNMRKQRNKLAADGAVTVLEQLRDPASMAQAIADYGELEARSWKAGEGTAVTADNVQGRLYRQVLEAFAAMDRAAVYRYRIDGHVVAMDLCIENDTTLFILKTAYDASNKNLSPAFLMREEQFAGLFAGRRIRRVEFYGKVMEWHTRWTEHQRMLYHANGYRSALVPRLAGLVKRRRQPVEAAG